MHGPTAKINTTLSLGVHARTLFDFPIPSLVKLADHLAVEENRELQKGKDDSRTD
jgi:hypothetical protein